MASESSLVEVANVIAGDAGSGAAGFTLDLTSNEPATGTGDGDIAPDVVITRGIVQVRAERAGNGRRADLHDDGARVGPCRQCRDYDRDLHGAS